MGGRASKAKGATAEREVRDILNAAGFDTHRTPHSGALDWLKGDICGTDYCIEVKRCEQVRMSDWCKQAQDQAEGKPWLLIHRRSREDWKVTMPLSQWLAEMEK
jgi:Holliday junction resolvase